MAMEFSVDALRQGQRERLKSRLKVYVPEWDMAVTLKKLTAGDILEATEYSTHYNVETNKIEQNETKKNVALLIIAIDGLDMKHRELLENEPAGVIAKLLERVLEYSGFTQQIKDWNDFEEEKKN